MPGYGMGYYRFFDPTMILVLIGVVLSMAASAKVPKLGLRLWSGSRNLRKPERECFRVPDDTPLKMPPESRCIRLADTGDVKTVYGHYRYIKYIARAGMTVRRSQAKHRRRRKA